MRGHVCSLVAHNLVTKVTAQVGVTAGTLVQIEKVPEQPGKWKRLRAFPCTLTSLVQGPSPGPACC